MGGASPPAPLPPGEGCPKGGVRQSGRPTATADGGAWAMTTEEWLDVLGGETDAKRRRERRAGSAIADLVIGCLLVGALLGAVIDELIRRL